jgi:deoxyribose-phosphate aldolase
MLSPTELAQRIELSLWRAGATAVAVKTLCQQAREQKFYGVCVPSSRVELAVALIEETEIKVTALIDFPFGAADSDVKRYETEVAVDFGAQEIETVLNHGRLKDGDSKYVLRELRDIAEAAEERTVKVVIEPRLLTRDEIVLACGLILDSGAHFVCAGTGLNGPAAIEDVTLLRETVGEKFQVKALADIRDAQTTLALIGAGAIRIGVVQP